MTPHSTVALALASLLLFSPVALATTPDTGAIPTQAPATPDATASAKPAAEPAPVEVDDDAQAKADDALLAEPVRLLQAGDADGALPLLEAAIAQFEARYGSQDTRWFAARASTEQLAYLLIAAADVDKGTAKQANAKILPSDAWPMAWYLKGYAFIEQQRIQDARIALEHAVAFSPYNSIYLTELAQVYRHEQDWNGMLATATQAEDAVSYAPEDEKQLLRARAWRAQGFALIELGKLDEAEKKFREAMKIDANDKVSPNELEYIEQLRAGQR